jgi:hypothetical protein
MGTKSVCQVLGHTVKLIYFAGLVAEPGTVDATTALLAIGMAALGTLIAKPIVERLSDKIYRVWANRILTTLALYYCVYGLYLLAV